MTMNPKVKTKTEAAITYLRRAAEGYTLENEPRAIYEILVFKEDSSL